MDREKVISWVEGLAEDDWRLFHSDSEVQNIAKAVLALLKEQEKEIKALRLLVKWATDCDFDIDGMVHVAKRTLEDHGAFEEGR